MGQDQARAAKLPVDPGMLSGISLFRDAAADTLQGITAAASLRTFRARTNVFHEGDPAESLLVLVRGAVELFSESDERHFTHSVVHAPRPLLASSLLTNGYPLSAVALEPSELLAIPGRLAMELISREQALAIGMMRELSSESSQLIDHFKNQRLLNATGRIALWMLRRDSQSGATGHIDLPFDKRVLASYLSMSPEQFSRSLGELSSSGLSVIGRSVTIVDKRALARAASPSFRNGLGVRAHQSPSLRRA